MSVEPVQATPPPSLARRLPRALAVLGVVAFVALLAYGLSVKNPNDTIDQKLSDGVTAPAPGFSLELLERGTVPGGLGGKLSRAAADGTVALDELRGTPVVMNLWASWCSPCREEAATLERAWRSQGRRGVLFLGIDMQDLRGDAREFLGRYGLTYPTIRDPRRDVAHDYGATGIPETYFISARGRVVGHVVGVVSARQLAGGVAAARSGRVAGRARGGAIRRSR